MCLTHEVYVEHKGIFFEYCEAKLKRLPTPILCGDKNTNLKIYASKGVMKRFQIFVCKLANIVKLLDVII